LVGLLPFVFGTILNYLIAFLLINAALPYGLIGLAFLALWAWIGYRLYPITGSMLETTLLAHLPAIVALLLVLYQELVLGRYWMIRRPGSPVFLSAAG
jgi:hypothetical protein